MNKRMIAIVLCIIFLLFIFTGCEQQPTKKTGKTKTTIKRPLANITNASAERDINALLNTTNAVIPPELEEEELPVETQTDTTGMSTQCVAVIRQFEQDIDAARNASQQFDLDLAAKTDAYVRAQEDYENALVTRNPSRLNSANATLRGAQAAWETAKDQAKNGREEVKQLKLALVKARDDCDPNYIPPYTNTTTSPAQNQTTQSACVMDAMRRIEEEYNTIKEIINVNEDDLEELRDELDELQDDLETAEETNDTARTQDIQEDIDAKESEINTLRQQINEKNAQLDEKRVALNEEREKCNLPLIGGSSSQSNQAEDICDQYTDNDVEEDLEEERQELAEVQDELEELEDQKDTAEAAGNSGEIRRLDDEIEEREDEISEKEERVADLQEILDELGDC